MSKVSSFSLMAFQLAPLYVHDNGSWGLFCQLLHVATCTCSAVYIKQTGIALQLMFIEFIGRP